MLLVESGPRAARVIRDNIEAIGLAGAEVLTDRVERVLARGPDATASTTSSSPTRPTRWPATRSRPCRSLLQALPCEASDHGWLAPGALVIVERATRSGPVSWPAGLQPDRARRYGEATFWYGRVSV